MSIRRLVAERIGANRFQTWFGASVAFDLEGDRLSISVPNAFVGNWIAANYLSDLKHAAREVTGAAAQVTISVADGDVASDAASAPHESPYGHGAVQRGAGAAGPRQHVPHHARPAPRRDSQRSSAAPPPAASRLRGELDSFVVGASNQLAYSAAQSVVVSPQNAFRPLFLHGGCGLGKTHLLQGICNGVSLANPTLEWCYISGEEFTNEFIHAVQARRIDAFRARFRKVDLLVIDDIHFLANKKATQEEFLHTFNAIDGFGRVIVLSSDRHPRSIATLSEPLRNRLISGVVVEIKPPDFAVRREILRRRIAKMPGGIPDEIIDLVARRVTRNVRELEGALYKLAALAALTKEAITPELVHTALEDYLTPENTELGVDAIAKTVGNHFDVTRERIDSTSRDRTVTLARAVAMFLVRKHTSLSFPEIGRAMGNKNHSTIVMAVQRIEQLVEQDALVRWKSTLGGQERPLRPLLAELEQNLERRDRCD